MAKTYTIKQGDTLSSIAKQYGTSVSKLAKENNIADPNMIKSGATINIPQSVGGQVLKTVFSPVLTGGFTNLFPAETKQPVVTPTEVNLGATPIATVKPVNEPVTVISYKDNPDGTTTNFLSDGTTSTVRYTQNQDGTLQPIEVTTGTEQLQERDLTPITNQITGLQSEIASLEKSIADKSSARQTGYEQAGIFDDVKKLNDLKAQLREAEDKQIEVPLEARQALRGRGATTTEFKQTTTPELEKAALAELASSRAVSRLTDTINTNIALVDQRINDKYESDKLLLDSRNKRLDSITKAYSDIITEDQKARIEEAKFNNELQLKNVDFKNSLLKTAAEEAIKKGANATQVFNAVNNGDIASLYSISGNTQMTPDEESKAIGMVDKIQGMLDNKAGLEASVGPLRSKLLGLTFGKANQFRTDAKNIVSNETINYFLKVKAQGGTFGAMSEAEWEILAQSNAANNLGIDRETGKSSLPEKIFKERLETYQRTFKKAVTADAMSKAGLNPESYLKDASPEIVDELYRTYAQPKASNYESELSGATPTNFIQKEEGFSPTAYQDQAGVWTIGYGTTKINGRPVQPNDTITEEEASKIALEQSINDYSTFADKLGDTVLTPNQFTALNSFEYNLGSGVWNQPSGRQILQSIKNGDFKTASNLMQKFVNVRNQQTGRLEPNQGLISRRQREIQLLLS